MEIVDEMEKEVPQEKAAEAETNAAPHSDTGIKMNASLSFKQDDIFHKFDVPPHIVLIDFSINFLSFPNFLNNLYLSD